ncbi:TPA: hypothetical protein DCL22_02480 [Candidatus Moranbacteria bacterium]|nr:hypothetical protein [Candidatus Moranbacteria bacterium]
MKPTTNKKTRNLQIREIYCVIYKFNDQEAQKDWFELPHYRPHAGFGFQKCLQNSGKIPCRGALRRGCFLRFHKK